MVEGIVKGHASAVLAASIFHFGTFTIGQHKAHMAASGFPFPAPPQPRLSPGPAQPAQSPLPALAALPALPALPALSACCLRVYVSVLETSMGKGRGRESSTAQKNRAPPRLRDANPEPAGDQRLRDAPLLCGQRSLVL